MIKLLSKWFIDFKKQLVYNNACGFQLCDRGGIGRRARLRGVWETIWVQVPSIAPCKPHTAIVCGFLYVEEEIN